MRIKGSAECMGRQNRKIDCALKATDSILQVRTNQGREYLAGKELTIEDVAALYAVEQVNCGGVRARWKEQFPDLALWLKKLNSRKEIEETEPVMFDLEANVV